MTMSAAREHDAAAPAPAAPRPRLPRPARGARARSGDWIERVELRPPSPSGALELFSGGNQQKVVLAKWLRNEPRVLLLDEPTQGVDVGAKAGIYELIADAAAAGAPASSSAPPTPRSWR